MNRRKIQNKNLTFNYSKYIRFEKKEGRQRQTFGHVLKKVIKGSASKHRENRVKLKVNKILKNFNTFIFPPRIFNIIDYNYSGFMDWNEFFKQMVIIRAKTLSEKINLFIKIADENGVCSFDWGEIKYLAKMCLGR